MESTYVKNLICKVINKSESDNWDDAVMEWEIIDCEEDESCSEMCICGKENITFNKGGIFCDCGFKLFRKQFKNSLTDNQLENLISGKSISSKKFVKKNGDKFEATIKLNNDGKIEFVNN